MVFGRAILPATGWATLKDIPPWHHTGFSLPSERMVCRTCPGEPQTTPSFRTKGWQRADEATRQRWKADGYRLSTFQYEQDTGLWKGSKWRLPTRDELDQLMGLPAGYAGVAHATNLQREQMLGTSMHVEVIRRILKGVPVTLTVEPVQKP